MYNPPRAASALSAVLRMCSWKLSFESNVMPSHLMCGDGGMIVVFISCVLGMLIDGVSFASRLCLVK
jgi:hypothetical protein